MIVTVYIDTDRINIDAIRDRLRRWEDARIYDPDVRRALWAIDNAMRRADPDDPFADLLDETF
jgi:hypothetical protein